MVPDAVTQAPPGRTASHGQFVCPLCETAFSSPRRSCSRCHGTLVVPVDESEVYETVLPMCGPDYHRSGMDGESNADANTDLSDLLSRLTVPDLSNCVSPILDRVSGVSRRI